MAALPASSHRVELAAVHTVEALRSAHCKLLAGLVERGEVQRRNAFDAATRDGSWTAYREVVVAAQSDCAARQQSLPPGSAEPMRAYSSALGVHLQACLGAMANTAAPTGSSGAGHLAASAGAFAPTPACNHRRATELQRAGMPLEVIAHLSDAELDALAVALRVDEQQAAGAASASAARFSSRPSHGVASGAASNSAAIAPAARVASAAPPTAARMLTELCGIGLSRQMLEAFDETELRQMWSSLCAPAASASNCAASTYAATPQPRPTAAAAGGYDRALHPETLAAMAALGLGGGDGPAVDAQSLRSKTLATEQTAEHAEAVARMERLAEQVSAREQLRDIRADSARSLRMQLESKKQIPPAGVHAAAAAPRRPEQPPQPPPPQPQPQPPHPHEPAAAPPPNPPPARTAEAPPPSPPRSRVVFSEDADDATVPSECRYEGLPLVERAGIETAEQAVAAVMAARARRARGTASAQQQQQQQQQQQIQEQQQQLPAVRDNPILAQDRQAQHNREWEREVRRTNAPWRQPDSAAARSSEAAEARALEGEERRAMEMARVRAAEEALEQRRRAQERAKGDGGAGAGGLMDSLGRFFSN